MLKESCSHNNLLVYNYATIVIEMRKDSEDLTDYEKISEEVIEGDIDKVVIICIICNRSIKNESIHLHLSYD